MNGTPSDFRTQTLASFPIDHRAVAEHDSYLGAEVAETEAFLDNAASAAVSRSVGYEPNGFGRLAPEGVARETRQFRMTAVGWRSRERPAVEVEGFAACRALFGLDAAR